MGGLVKFFLLQADISETPPGIIMPFICCEGFLVALLSLVKVFVGNVLMATEGVSIGEVVVELDGPVEESKSGFVFFLQAVAVSDHTPSLRGKQGFF